ncbi:MAG TPA: M23 family metallopeptidase [Candidatus Eremiobacteraeota bacterium]|nr:MAG: Peptidase family M23 [bacterium ADurb.Bin363]HPZ08491.1 M23 family metallopeptidase [Candidatus Eremiobacteraeota bacterium]
MLKNLLIKITLIILIFNSLTPDFSLANTSDPQKIQSLYKDRLELYKKNKIKLKTNLAGARLKFLQLSTIPDHSTKITTTSTISPLMDYLNLTRKYFPAAEITGRFREWRNISKYRAQAGLHNGYDIYLEKGTKIPAGWPGIVTAVTPWYGEEYGITVLSHDGKSMTYGHVKPLVVVGQRVSRDYIIALCWSDHVDIKMKDSEGNFIDFSKPLTIIENFPSISYENEKKPVRSFILLTEASIHLNLAEAHIDYVKTSTLYYKAILYHLALKQKYIGGLKDGKNYKEEFDYITCLKEYLAEDFKRTSGERGKEIFIIEKHIELATKKKKLVEELFINHDLKIKMQELEEKTKKLRNDYKTLKDIYPVSHLNTLTYEFPPEYIFSEIKTKKTQNIPNLSEAQNNLITAFNLYIQGLIPYDKLNNYKENYRKQLMKARIKSLKYSKSKP